MNCTRLTLVERAAAKLRQLKAQEAAADLRQRLRTYLAAWRTNDSDAITAAEVETLRSCRCLALAAERLEDHEVPW